MVGQLNVLEARNFERSVLKKGRGPENCGGASSKVWLGKANVVVASNQNHR